MGTDCVKKRLDKAVRKFLRKFQINSQIKLISGQNESTFWKRKTQGTPTKSN